MAGDVLSLESDRQDGEPLLVPVMRNGRRLRPSPSLADIRAVAARDLERLPQPLRELTPETHYPVTVADALVRLAAAVDERIAKSQTAS